MLENAGAVVVQPRERDTQTYEQVLDDSQATLKGQWAIGEGTGWANPTTHLLEGDNPFTKGRYIVEVKCDEKNKSEVIYTPTLPAGEYAVYVHLKLGKTLFAKTNEEHENNKIILDQEYAALEGAQ